MFVRDELRLDVSFATAQAGLARLTSGGWLMNASQAAYGEGVTGLARVGPVGSIRWLSRLVEVHVQEPIVQRDSAHVPLRWEATGPGSGLFPALDADIILTAAGDHATTLIVAGVYRPPLGSLGASLDQALLSHIATATVREFTGRVAKAILAPAKAIEPSAAEPDAAEPDAAEPDAAEPDPGTTPENSAPEGQGDQSL